MNTTTISATRPSITSMSSPYALPVTPAGKQIERWKVSSLTSERDLAKPLHWRRPRHAILQFDPFHESVPDEWIDKIFAVMALAPQHTFQVLTKRSKRMRDYIGTRAGDWNIVLPDAFRPGALPISRHAVIAHLGDTTEEHRKPYDAKPTRWPLPNVWLGVTAEDQTRADERIPDLLATPAAVRFVSCEPMLGPVDLTRVAAPKVTEEDDPLGWTFNALETGDYYSFIDSLGRSEGGDGPQRDAALDWAIVGGESGPGARPMNLEWFRGLFTQCQAAGVPFFGKQLGHTCIMSRDDAVQAVALGAGWDSRAGHACGTVTFCDRKGSDLIEWPADLRIQDFPEPRP